jgi:aryl-alcohol dehydrogenase-like predicted oxidoreductase
MKYRQLGRSGLKVSELCLGTMLFGSFASENTSRNIIARARSQGVNFIDSAEGYVGGRSEEIVGQALAGQRDEWVVATKIGPRREETDGIRQGLSRKGIFQQVELSLKRLGTDYIDIYYLHREDPATPLAESLHALADLVRQGKIRYYGISNHQSWKLAEFSHLADDIGVDRPAVSQLCYNAVDRRPEKEHFHITDFYGLGVVAYSTLARGVLTAKYRPGEEPAPDTRAGRKDKKMFQTEWRPESLRIAQAIRDYAERKGTAAAELAFAWALNNESVTSVIAGPRTEDQWEAYVRALDYTVTAEDEALIDSLVAPGSASTNGYADPADVKPKRTPRSLATRAVSAEERARR